MVKRNRAIGLVSLGLVATVALAGCDQPGGSGVTGEPSGSTMVTAPADVQSPPADSVPPADAAPAQGSDKGVM
jgi:hypothetical protein